jgi:hypothetical protein
MRVVETTLLMTRYKASLRERYWNGRKSRIVRKA